MCGGNVGDLGIEGCMCGCKGGFHVRGLQNHEGRKSLSSKSHSTNQYVYGGNVGVCLGRNIMCKRCRVLRMGGTYLQKIPLHKIGRGIVGEGGLCRGKGLCQSRFREKSTASPK